MFYCRDVLEVGDLVELNGQPYLYLGENIDNYSVFEFEGDYQRLSVQMNSISPCKALSLPIKSKIKEAMG